MMSARRTVLRWCAAREKALWLENRNHAEVFAEELEHALKVIAILRVNRASASFNSR
jgi:hypothetical protein